MHLHRSMMTLATAACLVALTAQAQIVTPKEGTLPSIAPLIESVKGAVVNVDVQKPGGDELIEKMRRRGGRGGADESPLAQGQGSGFIIDPRGLVVTNNHVVAGAVFIRVRLEDGRVFDGDVLGRDPLTDVALVKLRGKFDQLPAVRLGESNAMRVGDWVVAIGNPFGLSSSVSTGIISAMDRQIGASRYDQFLQTDAAINPGNSGGPLFNLRGEVIGMNTAIIGAATGIGFAVPSALMKSLIPQLEKTGAVTRGWLGVSIQDVTPTLGRALGVPVSDGALVTGVNDGSPAQKGGLKDEDVIVAIDGEKVSSANALTRVVAMKRPDSVVTLSMLRQGKPTDAKVRIGVRPDLEGVGEVEKKSEGGTEAKHRIGLSFQDIDPRFSEAAGVPTQGALVVEVAPGSPADQAGLRRGMVVVEVNRKAVRNRDELITMLKELKSGSTVLVRVAVPGGGTGRTLLAIELP